MPGCLCTVRLAPFARVPSLPSDRSCPFSGPPIGVTTGALPMPSPRATRVRAFLPFCAATSSSHPPLSHAQPPISFPRAALPAPPPCCRFPSSLLRPSHCLAAGRTVLFNVCLPPLRITIGTVVQRSIARLLSLLSSSVQRRLSTSPLPPPIVSPHAALASCSPPSASSSPHAIAASPH